MIGQTLNNRYTITARLGKGAMGTVYRADDTKTGQEVALKVISSELAVDPAMLERFKREGEALRALRHLNIVGFMDAFQHDEQYVIVMEYVIGGNLYELIKAGPLPIERARKIALDLCDALIRSHSLSIIHRDLKPENILIAEDGTPKLADFGVARLNEGTRITRTGTQVGTPYYMAPEAWEGKMLNAQADIWSLGVVLFEMLAGQVPFGGDTGAAVMTKVLTTQPPDLKKLRADVPLGLVRIVSRMLIRDKKRRYQTMREVAVDLERSQQETTPKPAPPKKSPPDGRRLDGLVNALATVMKSITNMTNSIPALIKTFFSSKNKQWPKVLGFALSAIVIIVLLFPVLAGKNRKPETYYTTISSGKMEIGYYLNNENIKTLNSAETAENWHAAPDKLGNLFFTSFAEDGQIEIFVLDSAGKKLQITHTPKPYSSWAPAPDLWGNLYFASDQANGKTEIYVIRTNGEKSQVTHSSDNFESWSPAPDGWGNVYFVSNQDGNAEIYVIRTNGEKSQVTNTSENFESWSPAPDGFGNLYFVSNQDGNAEIYSIDSNGKKSQVTNTLDNLESWSPVPDGLGNLYFTSNRNGKTEIFIMNAKGEIQILAGIPPDSWLKEISGNPSTPENTK